MTVATVTNVADDLLKEIKEQTKTPEYKEAQLKAMNTQNHVSTQLKSNVTTIVQKATQKASKAKTCKTNNEAEKVVNSLQSYLTEIKDMLAKYPTLVVDEYKQTTKNQNDATNLIRTVTNKIDQVRGVANRCEKRLAPYNTKSLGKNKNDKTAADQHPALCKELSTLRRDADTVLASAQKNFRDANKLKTINTNAQALYTRVVAFQKSVDKALKKYATFDAYNTKITTLLTKAQKNVVTLKKDDAELAAKATKAISTARSKQAAAVAVLSKKTVTEATKLIQTAYQSALAAYNASAVKASAQNYTPATTTTTNVRQRVNVVYGVITSYLATARTETAKLYEYNKEKASALTSQAQKVQQRASSAKAQGNNAKTSKAAQSAMTTMNKVKADAAAFVQTVQKTVSAGLVPFTIKPVGKVFVIPPASVQSINCEGQYVTINFSKKVYMDLKVGSVIQGSSGCYDANTRKKGAFARTINKISTKTAKKLVVKTKPTSITTVQPVGGASTSKIVFTVSPAGTYAASKQIVARLQVTGKDLIGQKATVSVLTTGNRGIPGFKAKTVVLRQSTTVSFTVPKGSPVYNAYMKVTCGKAIARSTVPFSINSDVRFINPSVNNQKYYFNNELVLQWYYPGKLFSTRDVKISFVDMKTGKAVYSFEPSVGQRVIMKWSEKVKNLPASIKTGRYKLLLKVDEVRVNSVPFEIIRTDNAFTKVTFTSPKHGSSYNKGSVMTIKWDVQNVQKGDVMSVYLDSEDDSFWQNLGDIFNKPILKNVNMENRRATYIVDEKLYGSSKYFLKAQWKNGQEIKSDLFTLNKQNCFSFNPVTIKEISEGKYRVTVNFKRIGGCGLKSTDDITLVLAEIRSNDEVKQNKRVLKASKTSYSETFVVSGKFSKVRFLIKHKNNEKGEPSDDFNVPSVKRFNFTLNKFSVSLSCASCTSCVDSKCKTVFTLNGKTGKIETGHIAYSQTPDSKAVDMTNIWPLFCKVCKAFDTKTNAYFKGLREKLSKPDAMKKLAGDSASAKEAETLEKQGKVSQFLSGYVTGYRPSFGITCTSCNVFGKIKAYNLDTSFLNIKSASVEASIDYTLKIDFKVGISRTSTKTTIDSKSKRFLGNLLKKSTHGAAMEDAATLSSFTVPIYGASLVYPFLSGNFEATLGLTVKLSLVVTGEVTFTLNASGAYHFVGYIESDTNRCGKLTKVRKPQMSLVFKSVEISATVSAQLDAAAALEIPKVIAFRLQIGIAKVAAKASFKYPYFEPTSRAMLSNDLCGARHMFEFTFTVDLLTFTMKVEVFRFSASAALGTAFKLNLAKMCLGSA